MFFRNMPDNPEVLYQQEIDSSLAGLSSVASRSELASGRILLMPERAVESDGTGPEINLGAERGKLLVLTMEIVDILEQEGLSVSIWGSVDQIDWGETPLAAFHQKHYCGTYSLLLNLVNHPSVRFLRVQWKMKRWSKRDSRPMFGFYVFAEESGCRVPRARASIISPVPDLSLALS